MSDALVTTHAVKQRTVWAAMHLMQRAGCDVVRADTPTGCTLTVIIPPDVRDIHGARLEALRNAT